MSVKFAEVEAMRALSDLRLGSSSETIEAMQVAGSDAFRAQSEFDETRRQAAEAGLVANTARLAEIQEAMTAAVASLDAAAQTQTQSG